MELKSEIAFSFYLNQFSVGIFDSDKLDANAVLLSQIVFNTDPYLNYESTNNSYVNNILEIFNLAEEIKFYPCDEVPGTKLSNFKERGLWMHYSEDEDKSKFINVMKW